MTAIRKYSAFFAIRFSAGLQYRTAALAGVATQFVWGLMEINLFAAFERSDPAAFPMGLDAVCTYVWLQQAFLSLFMLWQYDNSIFEAITGGNTAIELIRPCDLYTMWQVKGCASRLARVLLRCLPILFVAVFLPAPWGLSAPAGSSPPGSLGTGCLFLLSLAMALLVVTAIEMLVYVSTFWTLNPIGVRMIVGMVSDLLCGSLIPLPFFPDAIRELLAWLPFASTLSTPLLIYTGELCGTKALGAMGIQLFWILLLIAVGRIAMKRALRRVVVQGG